MKKRLLVLFLFSIAAFAALPATGVIENRPGSGSDLNGGGFVSGGGGTDRTLQDAPHVTFDGAVIFAVTAGVTATITITGYTVIAGDVDNYLRISGGVNFTTGLYRILSVNTGLNQWTMDRNVASGVGAAMTGRMGGGLATWAVMVASMVTGNTAYVKSTNPATITVAVAFATINTISVIGYTTTRGDGGQATLTTTTNSINLISMSAVQGAMFQNLIISRTSGTAASGIITTFLSTRVWLYNVSLSGHATAILANQTGGSDTMPNLIIEKSAIFGNTAGVAVSQDLIVLDSYIRNNTGNGIALIGGNRMTLTLSNSVMLSNLNGLIVGPGDGNFTAPVPLIDGCVFWGNTSDGIEVTATFTQQGFVLRNTVFGNNTGFGVNFVTALQQVPVSNINNAYFNNTGGDRNNFAAGVGDVTLSADPFTASGGNDFSLNSTAGGGAALKGVGFPGITGLFGTGAVDIGALQSAAAAGTVAFGSAQ